MYAGHVHSSTLRAEMTRLRTLLGPDVLASRPYRLVVDTESDWGSVAAHLAAGRVRDALQAYKGPLLPGLRGTRRRRPARRARGSGARCGAGVR